MSIPTSSGKTSLETLSDVRRVEWDGSQTLALDDTVALHTEHAGFHFDYLWRPNEGSDRLFVLFSGDAMRKKNQPPVFQRWSWAPFFPGHCLYISDPSLHLHDRLGLAWYAGTSDFDPIIVLADHVAKIAQTAGVPLNRIFSYGSSGGGFAALRFSASVDEVSAIAINPQTVVTQYSTKGVERYLDVCFGGLSREEALERYPRLSLLSYADRLKSSKIIYIQNLLDHHHVETHYQPFCDALGATYEENEFDGNFRRLLFSHEGGHKKAETEDVFAKAMRIVTEDFAP